MKKLPKIDLKELEKEMELNKKQRLEFVRQYAQWIKKTPDRKWSRQQNILLNKKPSKEKKIE